MITLAIETSGVPSSVSLLNNELLIEEIFIESQSDTSSLISAHIEKLIQSHLKSAKEINQIAVSIGPGSYTGLRVGLATAKGLAFSLNISVIPVPTLQAQATQYLLKNTVNNESEIFSLKDARRGNAFFAKYDYQLNEKTKPIRLAFSEIESSANVNSILISTEKCDFQQHMAKNLQIKKQKISSYYVGLSAIRKGLNLVCSEKEIAYLEPMYLINNYE